MATLNAALTVVVDALLSPFAALPPLAGLTVISLVTGVIAVLVIGRTSNQARIVSTKRNIQAALFDIRLLGDDPVSVLRAFGEVLCLNLRYLALSLVPMLWMTVPLAIICRVRS